MHRWQTIGQEFGLICQTDKPWMASSVHALGIIKIVDGGQTYLPLCVLEMKTTTNAKTTVLLLGLLVEWGSSGM